MKASSLVIIGHKAPRTPPTPPVLRQRKGGPTLLTPVRSHVRGVRAEFVICNHVGLGRHDSDRCGPGGAPHLSQVGPDSYTVRVPGFVHGRCEAKGTSKTCAVTITVETAKSADDNTADKQKPPPPLCSWCFRMIRSPLLATRCLGRCGSLHGHPQGPFEPRTPTFRAFVLLATKRPLIDVRRNRALTCSGYTTLTQE